MKNVEFTSLKLNYEFYAKEYDEAISSASRSGWYILGQQLLDFEDRFAKYIGVKHCIGVNSGTDALILGIRALGIGEGDEIIVPAMTYIASILGITENAAVPAFVDCDKYHLIDVNGIEKAINKKTKAILPVHLYGQSCNMDAIMDIARKYDLYVIEDCAQCHGAKWNKTMTGSFGTLSCFSFYPTKPLGAFGDAGCICTNDDALAERVRMLRNYGSKIKYYNESIGVNSRLDEIQAAALKVGLDHISETNGRRISIAKKYLDEIDNKKITLPKIAPDATHVFHLFPVMVEDRSGFVSYMKEQGIDTQIHYPIPPYFAECYKQYGHELEDYPQAAYLSQHEVSLPIYSSMPDEDVTRVIEAVNSY